MKSSLAYITGFVFHQFHSTRAACAVFEDFDFRFTYWTDCFGHFKSHLLCFDMIYIVRTLPSGVSNF